MSLIRKHVAVLQAWACLALVLKALGSGREDQCQDLGCHGQCKRFQPLHCYFLATACSLSPQQLLPFSDYAHIFRVE